MKTAALKTYDQLTTEELFQEYTVTRNSALKWEIALRHANLIKSIALQVRGVYSSFAQMDDIINEGLIVLADAVDKYDPEKGRFNMFVAKRIRGMIVDIARQQDWVPRTVRQRAQRIEKARSEAFNATGRFPGDSELAERLDMSMSEFNEAMANASLHSILSLEERFDSCTQWPAASDGKDDFEHPERALQSGETLSILTEAIETLKKNEQLVLSLYYEHDLKMKDIAGFLGISAPRVSQIHSRALQKLRIIMSRYMEDD